MRYAIGIEIIDKKTNESKVGLACIDSLGMYPSFSSDEYILKRMNEEKEIETYIYNDDQDFLKSEVRRFADAFRRDDVWGKERIWQKSGCIINFFPIKVDSSNFKYKVIIDKEKSKKIKFPEHRQIGKLILK